MGANSFYRPQRSWGKVMFSQACVILFTGGCLPQCMLGYHTPPRSRHPPGADTPQSRHTAWSRHPPQEQTPPGEHTPPEQTPPPPGAEHAGRYGQHAGGTHPTGMQSCDESYFGNQPLQVPSLHQHCSKYLLI